MNTRMERLISDEEYGSEPADVPVDFDAAVAAIDAALKRILAEFAARKRGAP